MCSDQPVVPGENAEIERISEELSSEQPSRGRRAAKKFAMAALGAIPWVGGLLVAAAEFPEEEQADRRDNLRTEWLKEHQTRLKDLGATLESIYKRFEELGSEIDQRIESPEYLALVRQAFRVWDSAETTEKREFVANLISNSAGTRVCSDDVVRLFIGWLSLYHEAHFAIIRELHQNPGSTRFDIWSALYGEIPREDSAEADLYRMLIRDLSTGTVIRQARDTTEGGEFLRRRPPKRRGRAPTTMKSSFDDNDQYVLTELGKQFVHYTLMGDVRKIGEAGV